MNGKKEQRQEQAALKGLNNVKSRISSDDSRAMNDLLTPSSDEPTVVNTHVPEEATNQTKVELQKTAYEVYKLFTRFFVI